MYRIYKYHLLSKSIFPQYSIDGSKNIWIVKPSYNARGFGIHCIDNPSDVILPGKKVQSKIVQKYIERPFLLKFTTINNQIELRKFDIRQWVLVTSYDPLQIYVFSDFYLRICGSEFSLEDISDKFKHLSNYSV